MRRIGWLIAGLLLALWGGESSAFSCPGGQYKQLVTFANPEDMTYPSGFAVTCFNALNGQAFGSWGQAWAAAEACQPAGSSSSYNPGLYYARFTSALGPSSNEANEPANPGQYTALQKIATRYRNSDNLEFGTSPSYGRIIVQVQAQCSTEPVEEPEECPPAGTAAGGGVAGLGTAQICEEGCSIKRSQTGGAVSVCFGDGCAFTSSSPTSSEWEYTGESCETPTETRETGAQCETVNGLNVCTNVDPDDSSCISIEGQVSCYSDAGGICDTPECFAAANNILNQADGSRITPSTAGSPPKPNNGTPGQPAGRDLGFSTNRGVVDGNGTVIGGGSGSGSYDYFKPGTVANSNGGDNEEGGPDGDGEQDCRDEFGNPVPCGEPGECDEEGNCTGSVRGPGLSAKTFGQSLAQFGEDVRGSELGQLFSAAAGAMPAGSCPPLNLDLYFGNVSTNAHCELASELSILSTVFMAIYIFLGIRIIGSA